MSMRLMAQAMSIKVGNPLRKLVLIKLADNANDDGVCFPSYQYIADVCEISKASARNHIDALIEMGLVSKKARKNKDGSSSNLYFLHLDKGMPADSTGMLRDSTITSHSLEPVNEPNSSSGKDSPTARRKKYSYSPDDLMAANWIFELIKNLNPNAKTPSMDYWANEIRLMRERDKRTHREICELFRWANQDSFWSANILSPVKLREKWDQLEMKRQSSKTTKHKESFTEKNARDWSSREKMARVF